MKIINIRNGHGPRAHWVYADLVTDDGKALVAGTLEYVCARLEQLLKEGKVK